MSEENIHKEAAEETDKSDSAPVNEGAERFEVILNKNTNELIIKESSGRTFVIEPKLIETKKKQRESEGEIKPLTPEEFKSVFEKLDALGITWTTDIPPAPTFKEDFMPSSSFVEEYPEIQKAYPRFPRELSSVILYALAGRTLPNPTVGNDEEIQQKIDSVGRLLTQEYRSEFFFKYAIKVPSFESIDWEVVIKTFERGIITIMPKTAYALLNLTLRHPIDTTLSIQRGANEYRAPEFITVAVNEKSVENLMGALIDVKDALEKAQKMAGSLTDPIKPEEGGEDESGH